MKKLTLSGILISCILALAACGSGPSGDAEGHGGITATAIWPGSGASGKTKALLRKAPAEVAWVRMIVSNGTTTLQADFAAAAGSGSISGVPAGSAWTLTFQGLDTAKTAIYFQGSKSGITVTGGATTNAGTVAMYISPAMSGIYKYAGMWTFGSVNSYAADLAIRPDGKVLVTGRANTTGNDQFTTVQFTSDGSPDTSFGDGAHMASYPVGTASIAEGIALQQDGRFLVVGHGTDALGSAAVIARYTADGTSLDSSFGSSGYIYKHVGNTTKAYDVKLQSDGSIVVSGETTSISNYDFMLLKYSTTGALITAVSTPVGQFDDRGYAMALGADDSIYVAGDVWNAADSDFGLVKYDASGAFVSKVTTSVGAGGSINDSARAVAVQPDGKVVIGGSTLCGTDTCFALARFTTALTLDTSFGAAGKVSLPVAGHTSAGISAMTIQPDGKIVVFGLADAGTRYVNAVARFNLNGSVDTTFNAGGTQPGVVTTAVGLSIDANRPVQGMGLGIQSDGTILAAANANPITIDGYALARYWNTVTTKGKVYGVEGSQFGVTSTWNSSLSVTTPRLYTVQTQTSTAAALMGIAVDAAANRLYARDTGATGDKLYVIDTINNMTIAEIPLPVGSNGGVVVYGSSNRAYANNNNSGTGTTVSVIDTSTDTVIATIPGFNAPAGMAYDAASNRLYVTNVAGNTVSVVDTVTNTIAGTLTGFSGPNSPAYDASTGKLFVVNQAANTVTAITVATGARSAMTVGTGPFRTALDSSAQRLYVANYNGGSGNSVSVIDTAAGQVIDTITTATGPRTVRIDASAKNLYVDCESDQSVHVYDVTADGKSQIGLLGGGWGNMVIAP